MDRTLMSSTGTPTINIPQSTVDHDDIRVRSIFLRILLGEITKFVRPASRYETERILYIMCLRIKIPHFFIISASRTISTRYEFFIPKIAKILFSFFLHVSGWDEFFSFTGGQPNEVLVKVSHYRISNEQVTLSFKTLKQVLLRENVTHVEEQFLNI